MLLLLAGPAISAAMPAPAQEASAIGQEFDFDLAPQRLSEALSKVGLITGVAVLNDSAIVEGRASPRVRGRMTVQQVLLRLLRGTGLKARLTASGSIVITPGVKPDMVLDRLEAASPPSLGRKAIDPTWIAYAGLVQRRIRESIRQDASLSQGPYLVSLRVWIAPEGSVIRSQIMRSSGDTDRDRGYIAMLQHFSVGEGPPENLQQPIALQFEVR